MAHHSESSLETAACLWEAVFTFRDKPVSDADDIGLAVEIRRSFEALGAAALLLIVVGWTDAVETEWEGQADSYPAMSHIIAAKPAA